MGSSSDHPATGEVARGRAGPWRKVVPVLVGCDAPDEFPAGRQHPWGYSSRGVSMLGTLLEGHHAGAHQLSSYG